MSGSSLPIKRAASQAGDERAGRWSQVPSTCRSICMNSLPTAVALCMLGPARSGLVDMKKVRTGRSAARPDASRRHIPRSVWYPQLQLQLTTRLVVRIGHGPAEATYLWTSVLPLDALDLGGGIGKCCAGRPWAFPGAVAMPIKTIPDAWRCKGDGALRPGQPQRPSTSSGERGMPSEVPNGNGNGCRDGTHQLEAVWVPNN